MNPYRISSLMFWIALVALSMVAQSAITPEVEDRESITGRAAKTKAEGKTAVSFASPGVSYPVASTGLTHAVSEFTVVVGTPRAMQTVIQDNMYVATWYSIAIDEVIATHPCQMCSLLTTKGLPQSLQPSSLLPSAPNSILLLRRGGTVTVDGVAVTETENGVAALTTGEKYLFVVDKSSNGMARLVLNDAGIFSVGGKGETLTPISTTGYVASAISKPQVFPSLDELRKAAMEAKKHPAPTPPGKSGSRSND